MIVSVMTLSQNFEHVCRKTNVELSENAQLIVRRTKQISKSIADKQLRQTLHLQW